MHDGYHASSLNRSQRKPPVSHKKITVKRGTHHEFHDVNTEMLIHHRVQPDARLAEELQNARIRLVHYELYVFLRGWFGRLACQQGTQSGTDGSIPRPGVSLRVLSAPQRAQNLPRCALL